MTRLSGTGFSSKAKQLLMVVVPVCFMFNTSLAQVVDTANAIELMLLHNDTLLRNPGEQRLSRMRALMQPVTKDSLALNRDNHKLSRELNNLWNKMYAKQAAAKVPTTNTYLAAYDGKFIRKIDIRSVDMFAPVVLDTSYVSRSWFERTGNFIHTNTRRKIIERNLILHPGENLDVFLAAENERLMRDLPYIMDARFLVRSIPGQPDSVDLVLLTQDLWPVGFGVEVTSANTGNSGIWYENVLGYGHQFKATTYWDVLHAPLLGYGFSYGLPNIAGTYITSEITYVHKWNAETYIAGISREFRTTRFNYAGAAKFENTSLQKNIEMIDTTLQDVHWKYTNYDFWLGRLFSREYKRFARGPNFYLSGRVFINRNMNGPPTGEQYLYALQDKTQFLFSTGFSRQRFRRDNLIYTFGRTEDVPSGYLIGITSGVEQGAYKTRPYLAASASFGNYLKNKGYLFGQLQLGTFFNGNTTEQSLLSLQFRYFSRLKLARKFQYRNFATLTYMNGINRYSEEFTTLENGGGIEGLKSLMLRGNEKLVLNLESVWFSPFDVFGFRFAFFGFLDAGLIKSEAMRTYDSKLYSGLGFGVRIRNDQLVFDTFEIRFNFYPGKPCDSQPSVVTAGSVPRLRLNDFFPDKPAVFHY